MKSIRIFIFSILCLFGISARAQNVAVSIPLGQLPADLYTWKSRPELLQINLTLPFEKPMQLEGHRIVFDVFDGERVIASTKKKYREQPVLMGRFLGLRSFSWRDLVNPNAVDIDPSLKSITTRTGKLPEGNYSLCAYIVDAEGYPSEIITSGCGAFRVREAEPPQLISPRNEFVLIQDAPLVFNWLPVANESGLVDYTLTIIPFYQGQTPQQAALSNEPIFRQQHLRTPMFAYGPDAPPLNKIPNADGFIWQVQAFNEENQPIGKNSGKSESWILYEEKGPTVAINSRCEEGTIRIAGAKSTKMWILSNPNATVGIQMTSAAGYGDYAQEGVDNFFDILSQVTDIINEVLEHVPGGEIMSIPMQYIDGLINAGDEIVKAGRRISDKLKNKMVDVRVTIGVTRRSVDCVPIEICKDGVWVSAGSRAENSQDEQITQTVFEQQNVLADELPNVLRRAMTALRQKKQELDRNQTSYNQNACAGGVNTPSGNPSNPSGNPANNPNGNPGGNPSGNTPSGQPTGNTPSGNQPGGQPGNPPTNPNVCKNGERRSLKTTQHRFDYISDFACGKDEANNTGMARWWMRTVTFEVTTYEECDNGVWVKRCFVKKSESPRKRFTKRFNSIQATDRFCDQLDRDQRKQKQDITDFEANACK